MNLSSKHINHLRYTGILFFFIITIAAGTFLLLGDSDNAELWAVLAISSLVVSLLSYKVKFIEDNLENIFYIWATAVVAVTYYDLYTSGLSLASGLVPITVIYLMATIDFRKIRRYTFVVAVTLLAQIAITMYYYQFLPKDAVITFVFGFIAILGSYFYVFNRYRLNKSIINQNSIPEENPNSVIEINMDNQITFLNKASLSMFPDINKKRFKHPIFHNIEVLTKKLSGSSEKSLNRKLKIGNKVYLQKIVFYKDGNVARIYTTDISDVYRINLELKTAQEQLEIEQQKLINLIDDLTKEKDFESIRNNILIENLSEGIILTDEYGSISYVNKALVELLGFSEKDLIGKDISDVLIAFDLNDKQMPASELSNNAAVTSDQKEMKIKLQTKDGKNIPVDVRSAEVKIQDQYKGVVRIIHDITEEVGLAQQKDDFFSIASHELRTPLTVISGNIDIILQGYTNSKLSKDDKELLEDTLSASDRLIRMVNDFLNVSRLDQGRLQYHMEEIDPCQIAESVVKEIKPLADEKGIDLIYSCDKTHRLVLADEGLLKEIIINLAGNSIKFTEKGSVTISNRLENGLITIRVTDTGVGIEKEKSEMLFGRFQQVMSKTLAREAGGTGLGLYISREFARKMGGDLVLEKSVYGKGSTFRLTLPAVGPAQTKTTKKAKKPTKTTKSKDLEDE